MELLVGRGVGQLRFGMTIDGIKALIGEPSFVYSAEDSFTSFDSEVSCGPVVVSFGN